VGALGSGAFAIDACHSVKLMRAWSRSVLGLAVLSVACGSADTSAFHGSPSFVEGTGGASDSSGGAASAASSGGSGAGALGGVSGAGVTGSGGMLASGGSASGGSPSAGGASGGSGPAAGGAPSAPPLPMGGIVTSKCTDCASAKCPSEVIACEADSSCMTISTCLTTCPFASCASCAFSAPATFGTLSQCLKANCSGVCPIVS